jgi:hypothetical protein
LQALLPETFGQTVSLDTSHILAWVKENNPRQYIKEGRFDKEKAHYGFQGGKKLAKKPE